MAICAYADPTECRNFYLSLLGFTPLVSLIQSYSKVIITRDFNYFSVSFVDTPPFMAINIKWKYIQLYGLSSGPLIDISPWDIVEYDCLLYASSFLHSLVCLLQ